MPWQHTHVTPRTDLSELAPENARKMGLGVGKPLPVKVISHHVIMCRIIVKIHVSV